MRLKRVLGAIVVLAVVVAIGGGLAYMFGLFPTVDDVKPGERDMRHEEDPRFKDIMSDNGSSLVLEAESIEQGIHYRIYEIRTRHNLSEPSATLEMHSAARANSHMMYKQGYEGPAPPGSSVRERHKGLETMNYCENFDSYTLVRTFEPESVENGTMQFPPERLLGAQIVGNVTETEEGQDFVLATDPDEGEWQRMAYGVGVYMVETETADGSPAVKMYVTIDSCQRK